MAKYGALKYGTILYGPGESGPLPAWFSEYGFRYGACDPGQTASVALGCLYIHLRNGDTRASGLARRLLDDLRLRRWDPDMGGYKSDYHYAWLNALVLQAFGLAVNGAPRQAHCFPATADDQTHFDTMLSWLFAHVGDVKPNLLNMDLIPFTYLEDAEVWEYAPHYVFMRQMGSLEALVLMLGAALEQAKSGGDWFWFDRLLRFILVEDLMALSPAQIRSLTSSQEWLGVKNLVRVRYGDYDRDNSKYAEARDEQALASYGEQAVDLDFRYGGPVVLENPDLAQLLASRLLQRLARPWEVAEVETWLEGARLELGDKVAVTSEFHAWDSEEFTVSGKELDLGRRLTRLRLTRPLRCDWAWAVDTAGTAFDAWAIDRPDTGGADWTYRAYAG